MDFQADKLYEEYHRIDIIMKGNLQRRIRRAWLKKKERIAEKKRKKAEAAEAAKKNKFGKKKRATVAPAATTTSLGGTIKPNPSSSKVTEPPKPTEAAAPQKEKVEFSETGVNLIITQQLS